MKAFKKVLAVALVAVMALAMFTACGVSDSTLKDELKDQTKLTYSTALKSNKAFTAVKDVLDDMKSSTEKSDIKEKLDSAIEKNEENLDGAKIFYSVGGDEEELAKDIKSQLSKDGGTYTNFYYTYRNFGINTKRNTVIVIVK